VTGDGDAADTLLVMRHKRGTDTAEMFVTGRDIDEARHRMEFKRNPERSDMSHSESGTCRKESRDSSLEHTGWQITGEIEEDDDVLEGKRWRKVEVLEIEGKPMKSGEIVKAVGMNQQYASKLFKKMITEGLLVSPSFGVYDLPKRGETNESSVS